MFRYSPILLFVALLLSLSAFAFKTSSESQVDIVRALYLKGIEDFRKKADTLDAAVRAMSGSEQSIQQVRDAFFRGRESYKRIEFLVGYFDRLAAGKVNGAPLERVDESSTQRTIVQPEGFQSIEEFLFGDQAVEAKDELQNLTERLQYRAGKMWEFAQKMPMEDRLVFEGMREGILRVGFMGVTGFDSPVALHSIPEAEASLIGLRECAAIYQPELARKSSSTAKRLDLAFADALNYLKEHRDFNTFDRLTFIREKLNPLYAELLAAHYALGYPTAGQVSSFTRPVRYESDNIFSADAINPFFFSPDPRDGYDARQAEIGRILFFDPILSGNRLRSCSSCHNPDMAFTDGRAKSLDITSTNALGRNAPTLINVAFQTKYFWDGRTEQLEQQIEDVLLNHSEMAGTFEEILVKLRRSPEYRHLFAQAFAGRSDTAITKYAVTRSLAAYMRTLTGMNSEFDRYARGETDQIDSSVKRGFNVFMGKGKCGTCHFAPLFSGTVPPSYFETETEVLGVPATPDTLHPVLDTDPGRYNRYHDEIYQRSFKTMTVRNSALTAPYMHNGVFQTLEEVIDFYDRGGGAGLGLAVPNQTLPSDRLNLTQQEKSDLVAFIKTLSDTTGTTTRPDHLPKFPDNPEWNGRKVEY